MAALLDKFFRRTKEMKGFLRMAAVMAASAVMLSGCSDKAAETNETAETTKARETAETGASLTITAEPVTEDEFGMLYTEAMDEPSAEDFTKITISVEMTGMTPGTERNVKMPVLRTLMNDAGIGELFMLGSGGSQNDPEEDHSEFTSVNYIYSRELTEDDIMDVMSEAEAVASYTGADGQTVEEVLPFADNIEFKA